MRALPAGRSKRTPPVFTTGCSCPQASLAATACMSSQQRGSIMQCALQNVSTQQEELHLNTCYEGQGARRSRLGPARLQLIN